jgi:signal transduction histidine kinase/CheY-like chemotaxis protein
VARAATGSSVERFELQLTDGKGRLRTLDVTLSPFRDGAGELRYLIAEGRDITELVAAKERRAVTQRLELVGQLAGGVAHDFNNVLMVILTSAEVLRLDLAALGPPTKAIKDSLDTIAGAGHHASDLTRRLLSFGRRGVGLEKRAGSLHALIDTTTRLLQRTLPANVRVVCEPRAASDLVHGDLAALESALFNLALNARDAMPAGGTLTFTTSTLELDAEACRQSGFDVAPGAYVRVSVRDTGTGIAPQHLGRLFEPFFTTKEEGRGTGLGLASVFAVVREHAGLVQVESQLGQGTTFHLTLPLSKEAPARASAAATPKRFDRRRALVVDDEAQLRKTLVRLLVVLGFECVQAGSAEEALPLDDGSFDVLVTDLVLPGRRGSALAMELLERTPSLRALLISGFPKDSELATLPAQRVRLLAKPFSYEELQEALGALLPPSDGPR